MRPAAVAISPIVGGAALKGPADRMLEELGHESSVVGVERLYRDIELPVADVLVTPEGVEWFTSERTATPHTHGTGCTYSAAITALLARGLELREAVGRAKQFIAEAIRTNPGLGHGHGPVNHFAVGEG